MPTCAESRKKNGVAKATQRTKLVGDLWERSERLLDLPSRPSRVRETISLAAFLPGACSRPSVIF